MTLGQLVHPALSKRHETISCSQPRAVRLPIGEAHQPLVAHRVPHLRSGQGKRAGHREHISAAGADWRHTGCHPAGCVHAALQTDTRQRAIQRGMCMVTDAHSGHAACKAISTLLARSASKAMRPGPRSSGTSSSICSANGCIPSASSVCITSDPSYAVQQALASPATLLRRASGISKINRTSLLSARSSQPVRMPTRQRVVAVCWQARRHLIAIDRVSAAR